MSGMRRAIPFAIVTAIGAFFLAGHLLRGHLGIEFSQESLRELVEGLGWKAAAIFVGLVTFRQFLLLPSALVLPVGGLVFGVELGTVLGAVGILGSALFSYGMARSLGREWFRPYFGAAVDAFHRRASAAGPMVVGLATAHPAGPMSAAFWGAGFASLRAVPFVIAVLVAAPIRAFALSFFGATLLDPGTPRFWLATVVLALIGLAPLAHPGVRARLLHLAGRGGA